MIKAFSTIQNCCSATGGFIWDKASRSCAAINETINRIGLHKIALFSAVLGFSMVYHNITFISCIIGGICHLQVNDITQKIASLYNYYLYVVDPIVDSFKIGGWRVMFLPVHGTALTVSIVAIIILKPVSTLILPPIFCGALLGASLVTAALKVQAQSNQTAPI